MIRRQTTFTSQNSGATNQILGSISGLAYANDKHRWNAFVARFQPHRSPADQQSGPDVLQPGPDAAAGHCGAAALYQARCEGYCINRGATNVLGQSSFSAITAATAANGLSLPLAVAYDGVHVAVADTANNRVLIWNELPTSVGQSADVVLGQPDFTTVGVRGAHIQQSPRSARRMVPGPAIVCRRYAEQSRADLEYDSYAKQSSPPILFSASPISQAFRNSIRLSKALNSSATTLLSPTSVTSDGKRLFVADLGYSRVLIWNSIPTTNSPNRPMSKSGPTGYGDGVR